MKCLRIMVSSALLLMLCSGCTAQLDSGVNEDEARIVYSLRLTQDFLADDVLGFMAGDSIPSGAIADGVLIIGADGAGFTQDILFELVKMEWKGQVTVVSEKAINGEVPSSWACVVDPDLLPKLRATSFPALYIVEDGIVRFRVNPFTVICWEGVVAALHGDYGATGAFLRQGDSVGTLSLSDTNGNPVVLKPDESTVVVLLTPSCTICSDAIDWVTHLPGDLRSKLLFIISDVSDEALTALEALKEKTGVDPGFDLGQAKTGLSDKTLQMMDRLKDYGPVFLDLSDGVQHRWGVTIWPSLVVTDCFGVAQSRMALSWAQGPTDGLYFADPVDALRNVLSKLP